jgi:hypothetical protein
MERLKLIAVTANGQSFYLKIFILTIYSFRS